MKIGDIKHNHSLTDLLKVILFSILMILPFLSVASRCLYVINNKNAKDSYYGQTINETELNLVTTNTDMVINDKYKFINVPNSQVVNDNMSLIYFRNIENLDAVNIPQTDLDNILNSSYFDCTYYNDVNYIVFYNGLSNVQTVINLTTRDINFDFTLVRYESHNHEINEIFNSYIYKYNYNKYSYLDNAFEYSVSKLEENNLFNWTENTGVYTGVKTMTDNLQIEMPVIPMIITYWFLLTVIYIIIDLIVKAFTTLTHMVIKKTT